jgi:glutaminase
MAPSRRGAVYATAPATNSRNQWLYDVGLPAKSGSSDWIC